MHHEETIWRQDYFEECGEVVVCAEDVIGHQYNRTLQLKIFHVKNKTGKGFVYAIWYGGREHQIGYITYGETTEQYQQVAREGLNAISIRDEQLKEEIMLIMLGA